MLMNFQLSLLEKITLQSFFGCTFTIELEMNIDIEIINRAIEAQLTFEHQHVKMKQTSDKRIRIFLLENDPFIDDVILYEYKSSDIDFVKDQLMLYLSLDLKFPLNGYVMSANPYASSPQLIRGTKVTNNLLTFSNFCPTDIEFPFCTNVIYFNSSSLLHDSLTCHTRHDKDLCDYYALTMLLNMLYEYMVDPVTSSVDYCIITRYDRT